MKNFTQLPGGELLFKLGKARFYGDKQGETFKVRELQLSPAEAGEMAAELVQTLGMSSPANEAPAVSKAFAEAFAAALTIGQLDLLLDAVETARNDMVARS